MEPSQRAIDYLRANPHTADLFDEKFGQGMAANVLSSTKQVPATSQKTEAPTEGAFERALGMAGRAIAPTVTGANIGSRFGPGGTLVGSAALPLGDLLNTILNLGYEPLTGRKLQMPSQIAQRAMTGAGVPAAPETQTTQEKVISTGLAAGSSIPQQVKALATLGTQAGTQLGRELAKKFAAAPEVQAVAAPVAGVAGETTMQATDNPLLAQLAAVAAGGAAGVRPKQRFEAPSSQTLEKVAANRYQMLSDSGIKLDTGEFTTDMANIAKNLRSDEGYTPKLYPKVAGAIEELTSQAQPKDWAELQALRKMIKGGQKSVDPEEKRLASILLDEYDNYLLTVNPSKVVAGNAKEVGKTWQEARDAYSKMKKAEVFEDILDTAKLDKSKFTMSGAENSMAQQLRNLAKNDKKMRLFTKEEQDAIRKAAEGGTVQNLLKFVGRFTPTGPVSAILPAGISFAEPSVGVPILATTAASRLAATQMRKQSIEDLINQMRLGQRPPVTGGMLRNVPVTATRGLLSQQQLDEELNQYR